MALISLAAGITAQPVPAQAIDLAKLQTALPGLNLSAEEWQILSQGGILSRFSEGPSPLELNPITRSRQAILSRSQAAGANLGIEILAAMRLPDSIAAASNPDLILYNVLHRFSSMEGLEYWSESRQETRTFYTLSHLINPARPQQALADPVYQSIPGQEELYLRQRDQSFGDNRYRLGFTSFPESSQADSSSLLAHPGLHLSMENLTTMWYSLIPIAGPGKVHIDLTISRTDSLLFFYGTSSLSVPTIFGIRERAQDSFYNRIAALLSWFTREIQR